MIIPLVPAARTAPTQDCRTAPAARRNGTAADRGSASGRAAVVPPTALLESVERDAGAATLALMLIDVDDFHVVNERHGHRAGDGLLDVMADRLAGALRTGDLITRLGGDQFAVLAAGVDEAARASAVADRLLASVRHPFVLDGKPCPASACAGIALGPEHGRDAHRLLRAARTALRRAKQRGPDAVACHEPTAAEAGAAHDDRLEHELRVSIARGELELHYQPIHNLETGRVEAVEALVRWRHPVLGLLPPDRFMPLAERRGVARSIGERVLDRACSDLRRWRAAGHSDLCVSVNMSAHDFGSERFVATVAGTLDEHALPPAALELEITEHDLLEGSYAARQARELADLGVGIAIDDFGTKYSSLGYLHRLPVSAIKIDRSFVLGIGESASSDSIVTAVAGIAGALGLRLVAEGVEEPRQVHRLRRLGCHIMQGYLFSRPLRAADTARYLARAAQNG